MVENDQPLHVHHRRLHDRGGGSSHYHRHSTAVEVMKLPMRYALLHAGVKSWLREEDAGLIASLVEQLRFFCSIRVHILPTCGFRELLKAQRRDCISYT